MKTVEQELKLLLDEREYGILLKASNAESQLQTNYYFSYDGMPIDTMVRVRHKGQQYMLCYKHRVSNSKGVSVCEERECEISADFFDSLQRRGIYPSELNVLLGCNLTETLYYLGSMQTYRAKFNMESWTVELDKNVYLDQTDFELECENDDVASLDKLKNYLFYTYGVTIRPSCAKVERFFAAQKRIVKQQ